jgi:predicted nucleotidyltransferase
MDPKDRIPAEWGPDLDARGILQRLTAAGVDFVVIGGIAVILHGFPRLTRDLDVAFAPDPVNLEALGEVLVRLDARLRGVGDDVPFVPDAQTLERIQLLTLETSAGWLDVHRSIHGGPDYDRLRERAERVNLGDFSIMLASIDDLIAMKQAARRPVDLADIEALESIRRLRRRDG